MVITPNSRIRLLKTPIELDEKNQLTFASLNAQTTYFLSLPYLEEDDATYVRKDNVIRFPTDPTGTTYEDLLKYNYCMYQNTSYDTKWFYAFITGVKYINDGMTELTIETDVIETWKFDIVYKTSYVEREHVSDDTIGLHTYPEGLETGEYINVETSNSTAIGSDISICVATSKHINADKTVSTPNGKLVNGIYQGLDFAIFSDYPNYSGCKVKETAVNLYMFYFANTTGVSQDDIVDIFMIPTSIIGSNYTEVEYQYDSGTIPFKVKFLTSTSSEILLETYLLKDNKNMAGSYTPVNNKLLCYPYRYLLASNGTGQDVVYNWEDFTHSNTDHISFKTYGDLTPNCSIKLVPQNYKGIVDNFEEAINYSKYPTCSWIYDAYTNWLTQNGVNNAIRSVGGLVKIGSGAMAIKSGISGFKEGVATESTSILNEGMSDISSGGGSIGGGLRDIFSVAMEQYQHSFDANQSRGNVNSGDINFTLTKNNIQFYKMSIKPEYARIIDNIFSKFGYKVNTMKVPDFESRTNWNYIKTIDINLLGDIPQKDMQKIKDIFNNGITFWHNPSTFLDYSQSNTIVS